MAEARNKGRLIGGRSSFKKKEKNLIYFHLPLANVNSFYDICIVIREKQKTTQNNNKIMKIQFKKGGTIYNTKFTQDFIHEAHMSEFRKVCETTTFANYEERSFHYYQVLADELNKISALAKENNESYMIYMQDWFYEQLVSMQKETKRLMNDFYGIEFMFKSSRETHMKYVISY